MRHGYSAPLFALALCALAPSRAYAEDASNQAAAQALFEQARQLMADGKFAEACPKLAESQRLDPGAGTLLNLGHCYEKNGQTASAWVTFKDAAAAADVKHRADWAQRARERATALEPTLSKLSVDVPDAARVAGLQVRRDGVEVGAAVWGTAIPIDPGDHALEAVAPAKKRWSTTVKVRPGGDLAHVVVPSLEDEPAPTVAVTPPPPLPPPPTGSEPTPPPAEGRDGSSQRTIGLVVGGVGVAGVGVGAVLGFVALGKANDAKTLCPTSPGCSSAPGVQANNDAKSLGTVSTIGFVAGGAALAAGAVLFFTAPKGRPSTALRLSPAVGAGEVGLRIGGAW